MARPLFEFRGSWGFSCARALVRFEGVAPGGAWWQVWMDKEDAIMPEYRDAQGVQVYKERGEADGPAEEAKAGVGGGGGNVFEVDVRLTPPPGPPLCLRLLHHRTNLFHGAFQKPPCKAFAVAMVCSFSPARSVCLSGYHTSTYETIICF